MPKIIIPSAYVNNNNLYMSIDNKLQPLVINNKSCKRYFFAGDKKIYFNADFDSGNLQKVQQLSPYIYKLTPGGDKTRFSTQKTFFHFKVCGFEMCTVRFHIQKVQILQKLLKTNQVHVYKPIVRRDKEKFEFVKKNVKIYYNFDDQVQLSFEYEFEDTHNTWFEFAFTFPYSYEQSENLIKQLRLGYTDHPQIYFHDEVLYYTKQNRKLKLITITEKINCRKQRQQYVEGLFPDLEPRPFVINKPKIIVSGRVHPGQTPASYCIEGLLRFLLDQKDYRSYLLRKNFHFLIIPILNPDGVYHGMFRNDMSGVNLNRVYSTCTKNKHPTIWAFRQFLHSIEKDSAAFYFDFHAHPSQKQFFIYGNAFSQITQQVEAETFGKLLQHNCPYFQNIDSIFTQKQMNARDRFENNTKQGCGRVYVHKLFNLIHSYTVQCGYFAPGKVNPLIKIEASKINSGQYCYVDSWEKCAKKIYKPQSYMLMGKSILITILDLFHLNPYTRINLTQYRSVGNIRKVMATRVYNTVQRFRMIDGNCPKKMRQLTALVQQNYYKVKFGKYGLSVSENYGMQRIKRTFSLYSRLYMPKKIISNNSKKKNKNDSQSLSDEKIEKIIKHSTQVNQQNPFFQNNLGKEQFLELQIKNNMRQYKSEKKLSNKKVQDLYQLCRIDNTKSIEKLILQGESPIKMSIKNEQIQKSIIQADLIKKKVNIESEVEQRKTRLDHFLKRQAKTNNNIQIYSKKHLPTISRKLQIQKSTIGKQKDPGSVLPSLIIEKPKFF